MSILNKGKQINIEKNRIRYLEITSIMRNTDDWYKMKGIYKGSIDYSITDLKYEKICLGKLLCLGRSDYYDIFIKELTKNNGKVYFQSDYLIWIDPYDPYESLLFYIRTAQEINFNLEGILADDIDDVLNITSRVKNRQELGIRYMTSWEMNQILYSSYLDKTFWYLPKIQNIEIYQETLNKHKYVLENINDIGSQIVFKIKQKSL